MEENFVPAAGFSWATRFYDLIIDLFMRGPKLRELSVNVIEKSDPGFILEAGCGTGSLTDALATKFTNTKIVGLDIDPDILDIARVKLAGHSGVSFRQVNLTGEGALQGAVSETVDVAVSSLVFHHLTDDGKKAALKNIASALQEDGELHIIDWGPPNGLMALVGFWLVRMLDGMAVTSANYRGELPTFMEGAGFSLIAAKPMLQTSLGTVWHYSGTKAAR